MNENYLERKILCLTCFPQHMLIYISIENLDEVIRIKFLDRKQKLSFFKFLDFQAHKIFDLKKI